MRWEVPPIGARVRVVDVIEGVVTGHAAVGYNFQLNDQEWAGNLEDRSAWVRSVEVLELPRPDEPTADRAAVLARRVEWAPGPRDIWVRLHSSWVRAGSDERHRTAWSDLKDITVLYPGGVE